MGNRGWVKKLAMGTKLLYSITAGFLAGVAFGLLGLPTFPVALFCALLAAVFFVLHFLLSPRLLFLFLVFCLLSVSVGLLRTGLDLNQANEHAFDQFLGQSVSAIGLVVDSPTDTSYGQKFTVLLERVSDGLHVQEEVESKTIVYGEEFPVLRYGDRIQLSGMIDEPESFRTDTGRMFDYPKFLARQEVFYEFYQPTIEVLARGEGNFIKQQMLTLRRKLLSVLHGQIPDPQAALTGGVLLGAEDALGDRLEQAFRDTSLIHIVVLSGFNVTIVATAVGIILSPLSLVIATVFSVISIILFALLVGLTPTVVRASIMAAIALLAHVFGRRYTARRALILAVLIMVAVNPHILLFDPSFQLSAIATAGLIGWGEGIEKRISFVPKILGLREVLTATIAAQLAVLPLLLYLTGRISLVGIVANILVLPVVPLLMGAGTLTALFGLVANYAAFPFALSASALAKYIFSVVDTLANLPLSVFVVPRVELWLIFLVYGGMIGLTIYKARQTA